MDAIDIKKIEANKVKIHLTGSAIWRKEEVEKKSQSNMGKTRDVFETRFIFLNDI